MTVYHVNTREAYDELMIELEEKGCKWRGGEKPTKLNKWVVFQEIPTSRKETEN